MRVILSVVCLTLSWSVVGTAHAEEGPNCEALRQEADNAFASDDFTAAAELNLRLSKSCPAAPALLQAGIALLRLAERDEKASDAENDQRRLDAVRFLEESLRRRDPPLSRGDIALAESNIDSVRNRLARASVLPRPQARKSSLELDNESIPLRDGKLWLSAGNHTLVFTHEDPTLEPFVVEREFVAGETAVIELEYRTASFGGAYRFDVQPAEATLWIDGKPPQVDPATGLVMLRPGPHRVVAKAEGYGDYLTTVQAAMDESRVIRVRLQPAAGSRRDGRRVGALVVTSVGAAMVLGSIGTGVAALRKKSELDDQCRDGLCPESSRGLQSKVDGLSVATDVMLFAGAAATAGGLLWYFLGTGEREPRAAQVDVDAGPSALGLRLSGRF